MHYGAPILLALASLLTPDLLAQGCSDAGVCTAGPLGEVIHVGDSAAADEDVRMGMRMISSYAAGEQGTIIGQLITELNMSFGQRTRLQIRLPYVTVNGDLGENNDVGDVTVTTSYALMTGETRRLEVMLGGKFNSNKASALATDLRSLPMPYQTSLGTQDVLIGLNYRNRRIQAGVAYQYVAVNENNNSFDHLFWMDNVDAQGYFESAQLVRADDAVARVQYAFPFGRFVVQPGMLGIYHITKDQRLEIDQLGARMIDVEGSDGLTLNITADASYTFGHDWALEASFGAPVITREVRPDGLTRHYVVNLGVRLAF